MTSLLITLFLTFIFSCLSTAIFKLHIQWRGVMLGPSIDSTIVLASSMILALFAQKISLSSRQNSIALMTFGGSVGGIVATACGFAFPTLYFLDKELFNSWLSRPASILL